MTNESRAPQDSTMKALIIYDDFASVMKANSSLQSSAAYPNVNVQWSIRPWRVDMLKFPPTAEEALMDAIDAHLIVFAGRSAHSFPVWLQDWLEHWVKCRQIEGAALAVIGAGNSETPLSPQPDLTQFARRHGLTVIFDDRGALNNGSPHIAESLHQPQTVKPPIM